MIFAKTRLFGTLEVVSQVEATSTSSHVVATKELSSPYANCNLMITSGADSSSASYNKILYDMALLTSNGGVSYDIATKSSIEERFINYKAAERQNYTYGEITLFSMFSIFDVIWTDTSNPLNIFHKIPNSGGYFYDLGSGSGVPVFQASMLHYFDQCKGVEMLQGLHNISVAGKSYYDQNLKPEYKTEVGFYHGSLLDLETMNWTDGDIVFVNSTCFDESLLLSIEKIALRMKEGSYIVVLSKQFSEPCFKVVQELRLPMSWGMADVFIHRRTSIAASNASPHSSFAAVSFNSSSSANESENTNCQPLLSKDTKVVTCTSSSSAPSDLSRLHIVCISDTHGRHRMIPNVPQGDILIHSGDFTNTGEPSQVADFVQWLHEQPHKYKVFIAGNHDLTVHTSYYEERGRKRFHPNLQQPYDTKTVRASLFAFPADVIYLEDTSVDLVFPCKVSDILQANDSNYRPHHVTVYGSPWQPEFYDWAYNLPRGAAIREKWYKIPNDVDILITHGPPQGYGDRCMDGFRAGCKDLFQEIRDRIRPRLHVFGHIHENPGTWTVPWSTTEQRLGNLSAASSLFVNACTCDYHYHPDQPPITISYPLDKHENPSVIA